MEISCTLQTSYRAVEDANRAIERLRTTVSPEALLTLHGVAFELVQASIRRARAANEKAVTFWIRLFEDRVRMEIGDHGSLFPPNPHHHPTDDPEPYSAVGRLADSWGVVALPDDRSVVWVEVQVGRPGGG